MKILAIDGNSIMNRAFYGIRMLSNSKGVFTNALTGFMNIYLKEIDIVKPDAVAVAFDLKAPTFRHKKVLSYKANRKGMPEELRMQMPLIKEILTSLGAKVLEIEGYEADDILGTISRIFDNKDDECYILTGDRDSLQLVTENVTVRLATTKETIIYTPQKIREVYGVEPLQLIEVKALMGDTSDNISGVAGIGEKTALALIKENCTVEKLYENLETAKMTPSVRAKLTNGRESAFESKWLVTIVKDAPIEENCEWYSFGEVDAETLTKTLTNLEMFKLLEKLNPKSQIHEQTTFFEAEDKISDKNFDIAEITDSNISSILYDNKTVDFIYSDEKLYISQNENIYFTTDKEFCFQIFESENPKRAFDAKGAYKICFENGKNLRNVVFCCDLAGYLLNSMASEYTVENLCNTYSVKYYSKLEEFCDIASLSNLCERLKMEIEATSMSELLYEIEQPLCEVLASMETFGVRVDTKGVADFGEKIGADIKRLESEIFEFSGREFNISSPKQLGVVLFEELQLPAKKKTKTGYSTNAEVLEGLLNKHPIIALIIEYRTLTKLKSTYVDGLLKVVKTDGRVHSIFKQTETRTGRISSTEPNVQNIPVRKEIGRNMRKFFISEDNCVLLDADYSQIELRVLAHVCGDENMRNAFLSEKDIHTTTASQVFGVPEDFVEPEMRSAAKAVNFGIIYGIGAFSLSKDINVSVADADNYIKQYLANYPQVENFMKKTVDEGKENGYVTTIFGRRRYIPELSSSNKMLQAFGKRAAMNAPIQGAAADIIKIAMVKVYQKLKEENINARLILQVHDELIVEANECDKVRATQILHEQMQNAVDLAVPMTADVNEGRSWYDAKG